MLLKLPRPRTRISDPPPLFLPVSDVWTEFWDCTFESFLFFHVCSSSRIVIPQVWGGSSKNQRFVGGEILVMNLPIAFGGVPSWKSHIYVGLTILMLMASPWNRDSFISGKFLVQYGSLYRFLDFLGTLI